MKNAGYAESYRVPLPALTQAPLRRPLFVERIRSFGGSNLRAEAAAQPEEALAKGTRTYLSRTRVRRSRFQCSPSLSGHLYEERALIVSKDSDFHGWSTLYGFPPKCSKIRRTQPRRREPGEACRPDRIPLLQKPRYRNSGRCVGAPRSWTYPSFGDLTRKQHHAPPSGAKAANTAPGKLLSRSTSLCVPLYVLPVVIGTKNTRLTWDIRRHDILDRTRIQKILDRLKALLIKSAALILPIF
jgi:hypothetical protein